MNFLWVYGSEAHPEEYPFVKGYESADLGWSHPYTISKTMAERARRARWMKTDADPDLQIPMIIDYINDAPNKSNAIRSEFLGAGFYSGFVIDCDGVLLVSEPWAWFGPGKDWWGLPLAPVSGLHAYLDTYLASPPACYGKSGGDLTPGTDRPVADMGSGSAAGPGGGGACELGGGGTLPAAGLVLFALALASAARRRRGRRRAP